MSQTRLLVHVDKDDQIIGHITPDQRTPEHIYRVSALWLTNPEGKVLMSQRDPGMSNSGGKWGPAVAGTVEVGESYEDNIRKEAAEEIGLTGVEFRPAMKIFQTPENQGRQYFCQWYYATCDWPESQFTLEPGEVAAVRWMSPDELKHDIQEHPEHYIPSAKNWLGRFI